MAIKLNERTLALLAARSVPNQLTYLAMTVKLNERTLALLAARSSSKYSAHILTLKTAFSARICTEYLNRRRQMLFLLSFIAIANLVYQFYSHYKFCYINLYDVGGQKHQTLMPMDYSVLCTSTILPNIRISWELSHSLLIL